jgi:hypothetical protein
VSDERRGSRGDRRRRPCRGRLVREWRLAVATVSTKDELQILDVDVSVGQGWLEVEVRTVGQIAEPHVVTNRDQLVVDDVDFAVTVQIALKCANCQEGVADTRYRLLDSIDVSDASTGRHVVQEC